MSDPTGYWPKWDIFVQGALLIGMGIVAVAAVVSTGGAATPAVALAYATIATAGTLTVGIGASEVYESFTDTNPIREDIGEDSYDDLKSASLATISLGMTSLPALQKMDAPTLPPQSNQCFVAGTQVLSSVGKVNIETIKPGDYVWSTNPETGETALKTVVRTFINQTTELICITIDGGELLCTNEHPFYSPVKGWTAACKLRAGDILVSVNGEYVIVERVQHEILETPITVYNFEVADFHTYYVGQDSIFVHNACKPSSPVKLSKSTLKGVDVHAFKYEYIKDIARWDVYKDTSHDSILWLGNKTQTEWLETGMYLEELIEIFPKR